jgi:YD repeat-containing protein
VAYDAMCRGAGCAAPGYPQISVNLSNLALYVKVSDLVFGGPAPGFSLDRAYNMDSSASGPFGSGWTFALGDALTVNSDGSVTLARGSGRVDQFAPATGGFFPVTGTADALARNSDGSYLLATAGSTTGRTFSAAGRLTAVQDAGVARVTLDYDTSGRLTIAHYHGRTVKFGYDGAGHITSASDSAGRTVTYSYSGNQLTGTTNADGTTTQYQYDGAGNLTAIGWGGASFAVAYTSDPPYNSVASVTTPDGAARTYDTPQTPEQIRLTDGSGDAWLYVSNAAGLLQSATDGNGNTVSFTYDGAGRRTKAVNGAGEATTLGYTNGNLTSITDAAGGKWTADYAAGGPAHITDPNGNVWTLKYDAGGNLAGVMNPAGGTATAATAAGAVTAATDAAGNGTAYQYNADGLMAAFTDALGGKWNYTYDGAARAATMTDPGGSTLQAGYGAGTAIASLASGQTSVAVDLSGQQRDGQQRLTGYTDSFGNQIAYTYDAGGNLASMTLPGGKTVTYQYDHAHRLTKVSDWVGNFAVYRYDAADYPLSVTTSGGPVTMYQYDLARRLRASISTGPDGTVAAGYRYTYDAAGNRTGVTALEPAAAPPTMADYTATVDAEGHPVGRSDGQFFQYDARGYLVGITGSQSVTAGYDTFGRLTNFNAAHAVSYGYDSTGLRVVRTVDGVDRRFVYDLSGARPRVAMEAAGDNTPVAWYVYGLGLAWKVTADGTAYFYHFDGDGNVVALSNAAQGIVNTYRYDPSGTLAGANEGIENDLKAHGATGWVDDGNGLVFTGSRYQYGAAGLTLPAGANPAPPAVGIAPAFGGGGACLVQGVAACGAASARRDR